MKKILLALFLVFGMTSLSACSWNQKPVVQTPPPQNTNIATSTQVSVLLPTQDRLKFCNGADTDSAGFRKTITEAITITIPGTNLSPTELANQMLVLAAQKADITFPQSNENPLAYIKVKDQTAYIEPTEGWAGVSIFLCAWQPFVEVNLLNQPGIKNVVWVTDSTQWANLK